jgi:hypothetical protein
MQRYENLMISMYLWGMLFFAILGNYFQKSKTILILACVMALVWFFLFAYTFGKGFFRSIFEKFFGEIEEEKPKSKRGRKPGQKNKPAVVENPIPPVVGPEDKALPF